ncbi:MAG: bifunctional oligoribonuclease/PAP phosphatase NrnA [Acidobacteriota bacterium]
MALDPSDYRQLLGFLDTARTAAILTHIHPDADGVGSGLALCRFLLDRGLDARFIISHSLPSSLQFLAEETKAYPYTPDLSPYIQSSDLVFTVDNSSVSRLGPIEADVKSARGRTICIDHHMVRNEFWDVNLIDEQACATGEMIHDLIKELGGEIERATAQALYVAIWADTGGFRFPRTSGRIHRLVADLLDLGVEAHTVYSHLHEHHSVASIRLLAESLLHVQYVAGGRLAWIKLPLPLLSRYGADGEDSNDILTHMLSIDGVEIALLFRETDKGSTKVSLRSKPQHDINALARANGGGGHRNASGAVVDEPLDECSRRLVAAAKSILD